MEREKGRRERGRDWKERSGVRSRELRGKHINAINIYIQQVKL